MLSMYLTIYLPMMMTTQPVQWVEVFEHFGSDLDNNTIIHIWKDKKTMTDVISAGYRALLSDNDRWYLGKYIVSFLSMNIHCIRQPPYYNTHPSRFIARSSRHQVGCHVQQ